MSNVAIQSVAGDNCFVSLNGKATVGTQLWAQPYGNGAIQLFTACVYPGTDLTKSGGVVTVFRLSQDPTLAITAGEREAPLTLQLFDPENLSQLWAHASHQQSKMLNLANACVMDLEDANCDGGLIKSYYDHGAIGQLWTIAPVTQAGQLAGAETAKVAVPAGI